MKKFAFIIGIISLAVACNAIEEPSNLVDDKAQEVKQVANAPVLSASIDESVEAQTKSYLDEDWQILWNANDEISAFVKRTTNWKYRFAGAEGAQAGDFTPIDVPDTGNTITNVYAIYPYSASNSIDANGVMTVNFPATQTYKANSFGQGANTMVAVSSTESTNASNLSFKSACGYLMLKLYGNNVKVMSVSLKGKNNEKIAGAATISMPLGGDPTVAMASNATDEIVLDCGSGVTIGNSSSNYTEFWLAIPPVTFENGFTVTVTTKGGLTFTKSNNKEFTVSRGYGKKMAPIEVKVPTYLSAEETANSYIVDVNNINDLGYCFDCTVAGNGQTVNMAGKGFNTHANVWPQVNGQYTASLPAIHPTDVRVTLNQNNCIRDVYIEDGKIYFKASATAGTKGNAKILVMDAANDDPAWVWHIWCTDQPSTVHYNSLHWTGWQYEVMDRNLGAIRATFDDPTSPNNNPDEVCGFYYQGGNPTGWTWAEYSNTVADYWRMVDGIAGAEKSHRPVYGGSDFYWFNPYGSSAAGQLFGILWGGGSAGDGTLKRGGDVVKTMYDPCPPGYQVMPIDMLDSVVNSNGGDQYGWYLTGTDGTLYFPYNGAAWAGGNFWMTRGYVPDGDTARYCNLWTSGHNNTNMWYEHQCYAKDVNRAGGGTITDHILARGFGVRCVTVCE